MPLLWHRSYQLSAYERKVLKAVIYIVIILHGSSVLQEWCCCKTVTSLRSISVKMEILSFLIKILIFSFRIQTYSFIRIQTYYYRRKFTAKIVEIHFFFNLNAIDKMMIILKKLWIDIMKHMHKKPKSIKYNYSSLQLKLNVNLI